MQIFKRFTLFSLSICFCAISLLLPTTPTRAFTSDSTVHKTETEVRAAVVKKVTPQYPKEAIEQMVEGDVEIALVIDEEGKVSSATAKSGPVMLQKVCEDAARQWLFTPFQVKKQPVTVAATITFRFKL